MKKNKSSKTYSFKDFYGSFLREDTYFMLENKVILSLLMSNPYAKVKNMSYQFDIDHKGLCRLKKKELLSNYDYLKDIYEIRRKKDIEILYKYFVQLSNILMVMEESFEKDSMHIEVIELEMRLFHLLFLLHFESEIYQLLIKDDSFKEMIEMLMTFSSIVTLNDDMQKYADDFNRNFRNLLDCIDMSSICNVDFNYLQDIVEIFFVLEKRLQRDIFVNETVNCNHNLSLFEDCINIIVALKRDVKLGAKTSDTT